MTDSTILHKYKEIQIDGVKTTLADLEFSAN